MVLARSVEMPQSGAVRALIAAALISRLLTPGYIHLVGRKWFPSCFRIGFQRCGSRIEAGQLVTRRTALDVSPHLSRIC